MAPAPPVPDAWIDESFRDDKDKEIGRIGDETNVNRFFFKCVPPRCSEEGAAELKKALREIAEWLGEVTE